MISTSKTLSTEFSRNVLFFFMLILGITSPLITGAQIFGLSFKTLSIICLVVIVVVFAGSLFFIKLHFEENDYPVFITLIVLGIIGSLLGLVTNRPNTDDYYYVTNAVYYLNQPDETMNFGIHSFRGLTDDSIVSVGQGTSAPYDYFRAVIAYITGVDYLDIYYIFSLALVGFLIPIANFWLMSKFTEDTRLALFGTMIIICVLLILTDTHRTFGNFAFPRIYQGKAVALTVGIPFFVALSMSYFAQPSIRNWLILSLTMMAVVGMSTSSSLLFSILAAVLAFSYLVVEFQNNFLKEKVFSLFKKLFLYMMTIFYAVFYAVFLILQQHGTDSNSFLISGSESFYTHISVFINHYYPITIILVILSFLLLFKYKTKEVFFLVYWILTLIVFVANPLVSKVLIDTVIPRNVYWRVFYLAPFPIIVGVVYVLIIRHYGLKIRYVITITALVFSFSIGSYLNHFSNLDQLHFPPGYKLPKERLAIAEKVSAMAPGGVMLAPPEIYGLIPMLDSKHPQVRTRRDGNAFWLGSEEQMLREQASKFVSGSFQYEESFYRLINQGFTDVIVFTSFPASSVAELLITEYGYEQIIIENCCVIYFR